MRIVAGKHRGTTLLEFNASNIRPTIDRVRENIFNKIQFGVAGSSVLDLFGGTGAVSLEFLSRGADKVITVDNNKNSILIIRKNFEKCNETLNLLECDYKVALQKLKDCKFDYIFLDPPYAENYGEDAIAIILRNNLLEEDGLIIYEHLVEKEFHIPNEFEMRDRKKYGTVSVSYIGWKDGKSN